MTAVEFLFREILSTAAREINSAYEAYTMISLRNDDLEDVSDGLAAALYLLTEEHCVQGSLLVNEAKDWGKVLNDNRAQKSSKDRFTRFILNFQVLYWEYVIEHIRSMVEIEVDDAFDKVQGLDLEKILAMATAADFDAARFRIDAALAKHDDGSE